MQNYLGKLTRRLLLARSATLGSWMTAATLAGSLRSGISAAESTPHARQLPQRAGILVFLSGGPAHQDTFDLKPDAPAEFRGQFQPIASKTSGLAICEHLPRIAAMTDKLAVIRAVSHNLPDHGLGSRYVLTGNRPTPVMQFPSLGSVISKEQTGPADLPRYVAIDRDNEGPGFLGAQFGALETGEHPRVGRPFSVRGITLEEGVTIEQFSRRRNLAREVDQLFAGLEDFDDEVRALDQFSEQAYRIISSKRAREAFDLSQEKPTISARFGSHEHSQSYLLAARLIEAGVRFVTVIVDGWDTHQANFKTLKETLLPSLDQNVSALLTTLGDKGLLETTSVLITGEFGRTPKINGGAGRDHWAQAMTSLLAGGGVQGGALIGKTDARAAEPVGDSFSPDDLAATFFHTLGVPSSREYPSGTGRPITLVREGKVIREICA